MSNKKNYKSCSKIYLKHVPKFSKIRDTLCDEVEKSKKLMGFLNLKKIKRYSFEEIKEKNRENKENNNMGIRKSKINREFVRIKDLKKKINGYDDKNKLIPSFDENLFINEIMNICQKHIGYNNIY